MRDIFLPGPFAEADLLQAILGAAARPDVSPAVLEGHALRAKLDGARVALLAEAGRRVPGGVVRVDGDAAARLAFALAGMGGAPGPCAVTAGGRAVEAFVAPSPQAVSPDALWPEAPEPEWRAHLAEAAAEVMSQFGVRPASDIPALLQGISYRALGRVRGRAGPSPLIVRRDLGTGDVEALGLTRPYAQYFTVEEHRLRLRKFDGAMSDVLLRAAFSSGDAVTMLPFDPVRGEVLLIEQFRVGPFARRDPRPWLLEAVAGRCDAGETPEASARREAREEAGLELGRVERITGYYTSPGIMSEHVTAFVGEADLGAASGVFGLASEDEDIRVIVLPLASALDLVARGEVNNAPLLVSLLWLGAQADRLTAAWREGARG